MKNYSIIRRCTLLLCTFVSVANIFSQGPQRQDTLYTELKNDIVILSTTKETNSLKSLPAAVTVFSPKNLEALQVHSLKDLSAIVPNYFAADYGSKMTAPLYIRGVGARSGEQTVSMYVDNIPYFNTTSFDTELFDIQRIEVLRGTQGTLYGRNAMGGILNVYTFSPLTYEGTRIKLGGGSHGQLSANASHYQRLNQKMGFSVGAYYKQDDGYFENLYTGKKIDDIKNVGGRAKFVWEFSPRFSATYSTSFDYVDQGAFPYENVETKEIDYNSEGYYKRKLFTNGLALRYLGNGYEVNSTTGYQYLNDEMNMDQDYTRLSVFYINQKQRQNSLSQEVTIKSANHSNYQWSGGVYGFYDYLHTTPPVYMMKDGIQKYLQAPITAVGAPLTFTDDQIDLNGQYKRPTYGFAAFHQSTFNNIAETEGLSLTLGVRLDYEKTKLDYNADAVANFEITIPNVPMPPQKYTANALLEGTSEADFLEFLPKAVLKYEFHKNSYAYVSASRGYKAGGHNIQMFADLLQEELQKEMMAGMPPGMMGRNGGASDDTSIDDRISYSPEYSWNYEFGGQVEIIDNAFSANYALYYMDIRDVQITQFVNNRGGRKVSNAGEAVSKGFELGLKARPCKGFYLYGSYGLVDAVFKNYVDETAKKDYTGNHIPFAPSSTFSVGGSISYDLKKNPVLDRFTFDANYIGVGDIYWKEDNLMKQGFYGTLNARLALEKSIFTLEFFGKNILDRDYHTFLFDSDNKYFGQKGKPMRWGAALKIEL
ncbi:TonB-dependent receptor [Dysgonomonas sp. Marseille-P4361]|uniref:TonB-dependent receptor n=1 Tax=Dysgonomonas sp. Marseille-P4361 TaxID=2161820 RepID=UPI000D55C356|nr:TonB-dependent receptor plug domain-containing protein [Dysgonomonas sp. Marseille-P4361]